MYNRVRIRPIVKRFCGTGGPQLPPVDDDWLIQLVADDGLRVSNNNTGHGTILGYDQVHHFMSDPDRGVGYGFLILNVQIHIGGNRLWTEPTFRPGEALPDQFQHVRGWRREDDAAYLKNFHT
jgi:hypothetical protein